MLDQPAFNRDRLKAEKLIDSKVLEQPASKRTRAALEPLGTDKRVNEVDEQQSGDGSGQNVIKRHNGPHNRSQAAT